MIDWIKTFPQPTKPSATLPRTASAEPGQNGDTSAKCPVCGSEDWTDQEVLWPELVAAWQLSPEETHYINVQQGRTCAICGSNVRSAALAGAIVRAAGYSGLLQDFVVSPAAAKLRVLEINEAGTLHPWLARIPKHRLLKHPDYDLMDLAVETHAADLVIHSDTLEHVADPVQALSECRRVLAEGGALCYTIPIIVGRLTRSRNGLPASYHGNPEETAPDQKVYFEFGADFYDPIFRAGFRTCTMSTLSYPAGIAVTAFR